MIAATGWSWEYIDDYMTMPRLFGMLDKWKFAPPVHRLIADYLGYKREGAVSPAQGANTAEKVNDWDALRGVMGITVKG